jgi:exodeoxyribonuclease V beta subunit
VIAARMAELKKRSRQFGFDMLDRLNAALQGENGAALRKRITSQYPVALVDEFQDTAPNQYQIFNELYRVADNDPATGLFLIGDPKQSIYGFRGADIHSYLSARRAGGRHYQLGTNYRSTKAVVAAVNQLFLHAESGAGGSGFPRGASASANPPTASIRCRSKRSARKARGAQWRNGGGDLAGAGARLQRRAAQGRRYREFFAWHCAEEIVAS